MPHFTALATSPRTQRNVYADARAKDAALADMQAKFPNAVAFIAPGASLIIDGWV